MSKEQIPNNLEKEAVELIDVAVDGFHANYSISDFNDRFLVVSDKLFKIAAANLEQLAIANTSFRKELELKKGNIEDYKDLIQDQLNYIIFYTESDLAGRIYDLFNITNKQVLELENLYKYIDRLEGVHIVKTNSSNPFEDSDQAIDESEEDVDVERGKALRVLPKIAMMHESLMKGGVDLNDSTKVKIIKGIDYDNVFREEPYHGFLIQDGEMSKLILITNSYRNMTFVVDVEGLEFNSIIATISQEKELMKESFGSRMTQVRYSKNYKLRLASAVFEEGDGNESIEHNILVAELDQKNNRFVVEGDAIYYSRSQIAANNNLTIAYVKKHIKDAPRERVQYESAASYGSKPIEVFSEKTVSKYLDVLQLPHIEEKEVYTHGEIEYAYPKDYFDDKNLHDDLRSAARSVVDARRRGQRIKLVPYSLIQDLAKKQEKESVIFLDDWKFDERGLVEIDGVEYGSVNRLAIIRECQPKLIVELIDKYEIQPYQERLKIGDGDTSIYKLSDINTAYDQEEFLDEPRFVDELGVEWVSRNILLDMLHSKYGSIGMEIQRNRLDMILSADYAPDIRVEYIEKNVSGSTTSLTKLYSFDQVIGTQYFHDLVNLPRVGDDGRVFFENKSYITGSHINEKVSNKLERARIKHHLKKYTVLEMPNNKRTAFVKVYDESIFLKNIS